jgi:hypothetical protein
VVGDGGVHLKAKLILGGRGGVHFFVCEKNARVKTNGSVFMIWGWGGFIWGGNADFFYFETTLFTNSIISV